MRLISCLLFSFFLAASVAWAEEEEILEELPEPAAPAAPAPAEKTIPTSTAKVTPSAPAGAHSSMGAGVELGFSTDGLSAGNGFGAGLGGQYGFFFDLSKDHKIGWKIRVDRLAFSQDLIGRKPMPGIGPNTYLKSATQNYWAISGGAEWHSDGFFGRQFFMELLVGYAVGQPSQVTLIDYAATNQMSFVTVNAKNQILLDLGTGFRRQMFSRVNAIFSARAILMLASQYDQASLTDSYFVLPILFSGAVEYNF